MTEPLTLQSTTRRYHLPHLFVGQSQKEATVNAASGIVDAMLHPLVLGEAGSPPAASEEGDCWLVGDPASGPFADRKGAIAVRTDSRWIFVEPVDGLRIMNAQTGTFMHYRGEWRRPSTVIPPSGGSTIDSEARRAIADIIGALQTAGIAANT